MSKQIDHVAEPSNAAASTTPPPDFMLTGMKLPDGRVRVYASRDFPAGWTFGQAALAGEYAPPSHWHVRAVLDNMLVITDTDYRSAMDQVFTIWANADREQAVLEQRAAPVVGPSKGQRELAAGRGEGDDR